MSPDILSESEHYKIYHEYKLAYIENKSDGRILAETDFYGDPQGAYIDSDERFAVIYGCGIYVYSFVWKKAYEFGFGKGSEIWAEELTLNEDGIPEIIAEDGKKYLIRIQGKTVICKEK